MGGGKGEGRREGGGGVQGLVINLFGTVIRSLDKLLLHSPIMLSSDFKCFKKRVVGSSSALGISQNLHDNKPHPTIVSFSIL